MPEKRGFGNNGRNEGYKGASRGSKLEGSYGSRPAGSRGPRAADARGPRNTESRGFGSADTRGGSSSDFRSGPAAAARGSGSTDARGSKPAGERYGKPAGERYGKPAEDRYKKTAEESYSIPANDRYEKPSGARGPRPSDSRNEGFNAPKRDIINEERVSSEEDLDANQGDLDKLEGRNSVMEALKAGRSINKIFVAKGEREGSISQIIAMAKEKRILIQEIDRAKLDAMSLTFSHQGVIALTAAKDYVEVDEILASAAESGRPPFLIILDEITDSHNLGSILRTANAAGVHGIIIPKRRAIGLTSVVSKASAGAIEYVPVARVTNIVQTIQSLKKQNIWVVGTDSSGDKSYFERDLTGPVALVIGSEGEGMGKLVRESCDFVVNIPMIGQISSLNAAVAGAIVTYEIVRQRSKKQP